MALAKCSWSTAVNRHRKRQKQWQLELNTALQYKINRFKWVHAYGLLFWRLRREGDVFYRLKTTEANNVFVLTLYHLT